MTYKLTEEELAWLDNVFTHVNEELHQRVVELSSTPVAHRVQDATATGLERVSLRLNRGLIKRAHAEDFLVLEAAGRVRLSKETRKAEAKRLKRKYKKRKKYTFRYGRKHNKQKEQTKKRRNEKLWADDPYTRFRYTSRKPVKITREEWDRCIGPVWGKYPRKQLKFRGGSAEGYTLYTTVLLYYPHREKYAKQAPKPVVVYNGYDQAVHDSMQRLSEQA